MSRTGSTYARRWPISGGPGPWFALIVGPLLFATTAAHASWETKDVPGTPNDVQVWAPGVFSVTTNQGAYLFDSEEGTTVSVSSALAVGSRLKSSGCFVAFLKNDGVMSKPDRCTSGNIFGMSYDLNRVKTSESGAAYALAIERPLQSWAAFSSNENAPWGPVDKPGFTGTPMALGVTHQGGSDHALVAVSGRPDGMDLSWLVDGATQATYAFTDASALPKDVQAMDLFDAGGSTPTALFGWVGKLYRGPLVSGPQPTFAPVTLPLDPVTVTGVDVNTGAGSTFGDGFGMAIVQHAGTMSLLSAVPVRQPGDIGLQWRVNPTLPSGATLPGRVSCQGAQFCVVAQNTASPGNLLLYTNASPPVLTLDPNTSLPEGTSRTLTVSASDPDGDAVQVTVTPSSISQPALTLTSTGVAGGVNLALTAGAVCADTSFPVSVTASDGLAAHDQTQILPIKVLHTAPAGPPGILPSANIVVQAGASPAALLATPPANASCPIDDYDWTAVTANAPLLTKNGASASFPTPRTLCEREGTSYVYRVAAVDESGLASAPKDFTVQVLPWGKPDAPFSGNQTLNLVAGDSTQLKPTQAHACEQTAGFPGVDTVWEILGGGALPSGVVLRTPDDTVVSGSIVVAPELKLETQECASGHASISVKNITRDGSLISGDSTTIDVNVDPQWVPISDGTLTLDPSIVTPESIGGTAGVQGLNCLTERGGARARLRLWRMDGTLAEQKEVPVPGPFQFSIGAVCGGQTFHLEGELVEGPGFQAGSRQGGGPVSRTLVAESEKVQVDVAVPPVALPLKPDETAHLVVQCGQPASGTLEQQLPVGPCSSAPITWDYVDGPTLTQPSLSGPRVELTTQSTDFGYLLANPVVMHVKVDTGTVTEIDQIVPITTDPFVGVERHVENAAGADSDLIGVSVGLRNTTACSVGQVDHMERITGADYVPGSARFNDVPVEAEMEGNSLVVKGLTLEGNTTGRLTYVVRPKLLGTSHFEGQSFVRGVSVSQLPPEPSTGCGCEGGGSGFAALGLAGLAVTLRRRRAR